MESSPVSRKWVLVAGTGSFELKDPELWCAEHVPCELVREGYGLVVGGWKGVDHVTARAFATELARISPEAALSSRLVQVLPRGHQPDFPGGHLIYVEPGPLEWVEALRYANAAILIGGLGGTYETYVFATQERKPVLPIAGTGGDAERALTDILSKWREIGTWGVKYENFKSTLSQSIESRSDAQSVSKLIARLLYDHFAYIDALRRGDRNILFFSYSHKDKSWLEIVRGHFGFVPSHEISLWDDSSIRPGTTWDDEILRTLIRCRAAILIVTKNFLNSSYIREHELPFLLTQRRHKNMEIFWLLAEQVEIKATGLGELQAGHDVAESLAELAPAQLNEVLVKFATRIVAYLREE